MIVFPPLLIGLGLAVGTYGTLIGVGGAVVLLPVLILLYPDASPSALTSVSLAVVFLNALSGTIAYSRQRRIDYRSGILFALATVPGTIIGVWATQFLSRETFSLVFGSVLILFSALLWFRPNKKPPQLFSSGSTTRTIVDARGETFIYSFNSLGGIALSFAVGFLAGLLGIGGGIIHVPALVYLFSFPVHIATATSHFILVFTSLTGSLTHAVSDVYSQTWQLLLWLAVGIIPGAQLGAWLSRKVKGILIVRLLAIALGLMGIRLLFIR
ncbi:MAG: sulfite exporter TauE/SafE family protein [Chloroflexi bacterium]|nr:sulfite exporter TauE/SafE family protein [Chloroflexota bacterium]